MGRRKYVRNSALSDKIGRPCPNLLIRLHLRFNPQAATGVRDRALRGTSNLVRGKEIRRRRGIIPHGELFRGSTPRPHARARPGVPTGQRGTHFRQAPLASAAPTIRNAVRRLLAICTNCQRANIYCYTLSLGGLQSPDSRLGRNPLLANEMRRPDFLPQRAPPLPSSTADDVQDLA